MNLTKTQIIKLFNNYYNKLKDNNQSDIIGDVKNLKKLAIVTTEKVEKMFDYEQSFSKRHGRKSRTLEQIWENAYRGFLTEAIAIKKYFHTKYSIHDTLSTTPRDYDFIITYLPTNISYKMEIKYVSNVTTISTNQRYIKIRSVKDTLIDPEWDYLHIFTNILDGLSYVGSVSKEMLKNGYIFKSTKGDTKGWYVMDMKYLCTFDFNNCTLHNSLIGYKDKDNNVFHTEIIENNYTLFKNNKEYFTVSDIAKNEAKLNESDYVVSDEVKQMGLSMIDSILKK
jgi:hypothetical protein